MCRAQPSPAWPRGRWRGAPASVGWLDRVTILAMGLLCLAAVMARPRQRPLARWALAGSLVLTAALLLARIDVTPRLPVGGLLAAWPVLLAGLPMLRWRGAATFE